MQSLSQSQSQRQNHREGFASLPLSTKSVAMIKNDDCSNATPIDADPIIGLDDADSDDSMHQFLTTGATAGIGCAGGAFLLAGCQSHLSLDDDNDEEDDFAILARPSTMATMPYDRPVRTRPPSPRRLLNAAAGISLRPTVSVPAPVVASTSSQPQPGKLKRQTQQQQQRKPAARGTLRQRSSFSSSSSASSDDDGENLAFQADATAAVSKRRRVAAPLGDASNRPNSLLAGGGPGKLGRCMSESCHLDRASIDCGSSSASRIDKAIASIDSLNLIGNSEQTHSLPTVKSLDYGIRSVTPETVSGLLAGRFDGLVGDYVIVDCRYPYEFEGGHIRGAVNLYRPEVLLEQLLNCSGGGSGPASRMVIIFHCEFSSQRAPRMARLLRQRDREINADNYPQLHYPEIYLLQGGYRAFYEAHKADCEPIGYTKMSDPGYSRELVQFEKLGRAWERQNSRTKHSRLQRLAAQPAVFN